MLAGVSNIFPISSTVKKRWGIYHLLQPLKNLEVYVMLRYDDYQDIPDPSALYPTQKNLFLLDGCFLGKQNKAEAYYTRGRHNNCDTIYIAQNYF